MLMGTFWILSDLCLLVEGSVFTAESAGASTSSGMSSSSPGLAISFRVHTFGIFDYHLDPVLMEAIVEASSINRARTIDTQNLPKLSRSARL